MQQDAAAFVTDQYDTVYLWTRQIFLRDRVAAVSTRVAEVVNGQRAGSAGTRPALPQGQDREKRDWLDCRSGRSSTARPTTPLCNSATQHKDDPVVAIGTLRDDLYMHILPGRETDRFYLLPANAKVQMLVRASVPKTPRRDRHRR